MPRYGAAVAGPGMPMCNRGMAEMNGLDRPRLLAALMLLVIALFVGAGMPRDARWRGRLRLAAIIAFLCALAVALAEIALWWDGLRR